MLATCGCLATWAKVASMCVRTAGSRTLPLLTLKTIVSRSPACTGKLFCKRSAARCESEPGSVKLLEYDVPADCATTFTTTIRASQPRTMYSLCVVDQRASLSIACELRTVQFTLGSVHARVRGHARDQHIGAALAGHHRAPQILRGLGEDVVG